MLTLATGDDGAHAYEARTREHCLTRHDRRNPRAACLRRPQVPLRLGGMR